MTDVKILNVYINNILSLRSPPLCLCCVCVISIFFILNVPVLGHICLVLLILFSFSYMAVFSARLEDT